MAKKVSAEAMAGRLGIERESVYRLEREWKTRMTPEKQAQWADALGLADAKELQFPPGAMSLDVLVAQAPKEMQATAVDIVLRLIARTR